MKVELYNRGKSYPHRDLGTNRARGRKKGRAPVFSDQQIVAVEKHIVEHSNCAAADLLKFRLSYLAGLRAGEIAQLEVANLLDETGEISKFVHVPAKISKGHRARDVNMHPKVREAFVAFMDQYPGEMRIAFSQRWSKTRYQSSKALAGYFKLIFDAVGLEGYSSHSGRRTFITKLARAIDGTRYTICDVQYLAGHAFLDTTQIYIDRSTRLNSLVEKL